MTLPRMVVPGETMMLTRRCKGRRYRLRPSPETNQIIEYAYGYAAEVTQVALHAITSMSTHPHDDFTDSVGRYPKFAQIARRIIATCLAKTQGIPGPVFCPESRGNVVRQVSLAAMVEQLAYVIANPVTSFACKKPEQWRGVWVNPLGKCSRRRIVQRPKVLGPSYPESVVLEVTWPRALVEEYGEEGTRQMVERRVEEMCEEARKKADEGAAQVCFTPMVRKVRNPCYGVKPVRRAQVQRAIERSPPALDMLTTGAPPPPRWIDVGPESGSVVAHGDGQEREPGSACRVVVRLPRITEEDSRAAHGRVRLGG